ncbi:MAG: phosphotransferase [Clostridia bacterium]|nr:phosphotransferase [Clostridia bacterium]
MSASYLFKTEEQTVTAQIIGSINSGNAAEFETELFKGIGDTPNVVLDLGQLQYISSAGLRVLLKLKKSGHKTTMINVTSEVFEILSVTGFADLFEIVKSRRKLSAEGCKEIARGAMGVIYRLDDETILKVYDKSLPLDVIYAGQTTLKKLFINDIPCAIPFDIVDVEDTHGAVYELLNADTLAQYIMDHPEEVENVAEKAATLLKEMHQRELPDGFLGNAKELLNTWLEGGRPYLPTEDADKLAAIIAQFKDAKTFLHLDFHTKNVMIREGELTIIDLDDACVGDPLIDIACILMSMGNPAYGDKECLKFVGMTKELKDKYIKKFLEVYFGTNDESEIDATLTKLRPITGLRTLYARIHRVGMTDEERKVVIDAAIAAIHESLKKL